jgi:hypothetical protein
MEEHLRMLSIVLLPAATLGILALGSEIGHAMYQNTLGILGEVVEILAMVAIESLETYTRVPHFFRTWTHFPASNQTPPLRVC